MSAGDGRRGNMSIEISHYSSFNRKFYRSSENGTGEISSQETRHSFSQNCGVYHFGVDGRGEIRSQETRPSSSSNSVAGVNVEWSGGYRYQTRYSSLHNPGEICRLLISSVYSCPFEKCSW